MSTRLAWLLTGLLLASPAQAFFFCFSFGGGSRPAPGPRRVAPLPYAPGPYWQAPPGYAIPSYYNPALWQPAVPPARAASPAADASVMPASPAAKP